MPRAHGSHEGLVSDLFQRMSAQPQSAFMMTDAIGDMSADI